MNAKGTPEPENPTSTSSQALRRDWLNFTDMAKEKAGRRKHLYLNKTFRSL